jgi:peptidoglycan/xylan/chitin deacetylase (PgdA/CDA1 family)
MTWDQVQALHDFGIAVGGHTVTHCMLSELDAEAQERELRESKTELELRTGRQVLSVAYPFGGAEHFNTDTIAMARKIGFRLGFSLVRGINRGDRLDPFAIYRIMPPADTNSFALRVNLPALMLNGCRVWNGRGVEETRQMSESR